MKVAIVCIGDELMNGSTINSNSSWIAKQIYSYNDLAVHDIITLHDDIDDIQNKINYLIDKKYRYIFITGGLGPTHDDITKKSLIKLFNSKLVLQSKYYSRLKFFFTQKNKSIDLRHLKSQAEILDCSAPIANKYGTALGMFIKKNKSSIFIMPGVPNEMKSMMRNEIIPSFIDPDFKKKINKLTFLTIGVTESRLSNILDQIIETNKDKYKFAFLPSYQGVKLAVSSFNSNKVNKDFKKLCIEIEHLIGEFLYGYNEDRIEEVVGKLLIEKNLSVAFAESCTGGLISKKITDISGSSNFYKGSIVAYNNKIKNKQLNVPEKILNKCGAVSEETAISMAENIKLNFDSDIGLSTTGIAGPKGGTVLKPIGLVYICIAYKNKKIVKKLNIKNKRNICREISSNIALNMIRLLIK